MMACNESAGAAVEKIPGTMQTALQDLGNYQSVTTNQLRVTLTRSLDIASEALLADLDSKCIMKIKKGFTRLIKQKKRDSPFWDNVRRSSGIRILI